MHKLKKKEKPTKLPKPIKIKKEKSDEERQLHGLSHYVDDRLEMVKQIFGTLKPKTIINLAPEFLKLKEMEQIQELCLNELLGISTKRLLSIINATKCPTDTESDDSDVQHKEDHVSLEEISSDSEIESGKGKKRKKSNGTKSKQDEAGKKDTKDSAEKDQGQISVLELLELQARARAIRSQLALEPVTKIELDDAETSSKEHKETRKRKSTEMERTRHNSSSASTSKQSKSQGSNGEVANKNSNTMSNGNNEQNNAEKSSNKKIKLKRSYQKPGTDDNMPAEKLNDHKNIIKHIKQERDRSASPDVIPIVPVQETLMISDSSDEEKAKLAKQQKQISKESSSAAKAKEKPTSDATDNKSPRSTATAADISQNKSNLDTDKPTIEIETNKLTTTAESKSQDGDETQEAVAHSKPAAENDETLQIQPKLAKHCNMSASNFLEHEDDQDDVISLEGGDLESEMIEHLKEEPKDKHENQSSRLVETSVDDDVISLSDDDNSESWHSRYLKSSKVSKVLAESRLGKKVRDKIKTSKRSSKKDSTSDKDLEKSKNACNAFSSKHEDGSVEQYKELLEIRQRKA